MLSHHSCSKRLITLRMQFICFLMVTNVCVHANTLLWRIGKQNDSAAEFANYIQSNPEVVSVPKSAALVSRGLSAFINPEMRIRFKLSSLPRYGVLFSFKLLDAHKNGEQMGVFSNGLMAGLLQLWGTSGTASPWKWKKTYQLYIPKELLIKGNNTLTLRTVRPEWSDKQTDPDLWWVWDYIKLESLSKPSEEPVHGKMTWMGTTLTQSGRDFIIDQHTVAFAKPIFEWMGIAWSGNTVRTNFWYDVTNQQPGRLAYLQKLKELNMTACMDWISGHFHATPDGKMPDQTQQEFMDFLHTYGKLFQYYEVGNEPGNFGGGLLEYELVARFLNEHNPGNIKVSAPGWAYATGKGDPPGWESHVEDRRLVENLCQATNGHSYGFSYQDNRGGSFIEQLNTFNGVEDGWPKEYVNTETGNNDWHSEQNGGTHISSSEPHASNFDRILRAHIAVVDRFMQHAAIFDDFSLFNPPSDWSNPTALTAYQGVNGEGDRLKTYRRLALAYATHGRPLVYDILNRKQMENKLVYCRPVDTSALLPLPGSGGKSNRILLNFVNFENSPQTLQVRVIMPKKGVWTGMRIGAGDTWQESHSVARLNAKPAIVLTIPLAPLEGVQYILIPVQSSAQMERSKLVEKNEHIPHSRTY